MLLKMHLKPGWRREGSLMLSFTCFRKHLPTAE